MINNDDRELDRLADVHLVWGSHTSWREGACLMEAVAYVAGEKHSDHPACTSPVLGTFGRGLNDVLPNDLRQQLKALVPLLIGTADDGHDKARSYLALDWLIRTWLPAWLRLAGLEYEAAALSALTPITDPTTATHARTPVLVARAAARAAAWDATWDAARAAARAATWDITWVVAEAAARDAAWDAARGAAGDITWVVAEAAARDVLAPTVCELQLSAIDLFGRMITVGTATEDTPAAPAAAALTC